VVISHKYKYVYIQLPQTACTTVQNELLEHYDGEKILFKHALYSDFLKQASAEEKKYFVFSNVRNPLDIAVSKFFKYKTDHVGAYSNQKKKEFGRLHKYFLLYWDRSRYNFIHKQEADFGAFFKRFYTLPYSSWSILDHKKFDYIIRYENLQEDFAEALKRLNIEPVRLLPSKNVTGQKSRDFWSYFDTPELKSRAVRLFSEYMAEWNYTFPEDWKQYAKAPASRLQYNSINAFRRLYWQHLR
jgi:hypothetical protein